MAPIVETASPQPADLGFSVSHQKVDLDIDLRSRKLIGHVEILINPFSKDLRSIRLNSRQAVFKRLTLNSKPCTITHRDPYKHAKLQWNAAGVHQYDMLQRKLEGQLKDSPTEDLEVVIPKAVKIDELDPFSDEPQNILLSKSSSNIRRDSGDGSAIDLVQSSRTAIEQTTRFTQLTLIIEYIVERVRDGIHFVGWEEGDLRYPHAYTTNYLSPGGASCLFPCVDSLNSKCTWEISINCQKTVGDALQQAPNFNSGTQTNGVNGASNSVNGKTCRRKADVQSDSFSDEDKALDLVVVCTGDMTDEVMTPGYSKQYLD